MIQGYNWPVVADQVLLRMWGRAVGQLGITDPREGLQAAEHYQAILAAIPDRMFRLTRAGVYIDFKGDPTNPNEPTPDQILGRTLDELLPLPVADLWRGVIHKTLETGQLQSCEYQLDLPSGVREFEARVTVSGTDEVLTLVRDITDRKQVEAELRHSLEELAAQQEQLQISETQFAKAFHFNPCAMVLSTLPEGEVLDVNETFEQMSGYARHEVLGQTSTELGLWVDLQDRQTFLDQIAGSGMVQEMEFLFRRKSGEMAVGICSATRLDLEERPCVLTLVHDITQRKRTESQLQAMAQQDRLLGQMALRIRRSLDLEQILETTAAEVRYVLQADRTFISTIAPGHPHLTAAESLAPGWPSALAWAKSDQIHHVIQDLFAQHKVWICEDVQNSEPPPLLRSYYQDHQVRASLAVPIWLEEGSVCGVLVANQCTGPRRWQPFEQQLLEQLAVQVGIALRQAHLYRQVQLMNVTLEQQVQDRTAQLHRQMQDLEALSQTKDAFLEAFSHTLRTPIMGSIMVLKSLLNQGEEALSVPRPLITRLIQGNERQLNMINALIEAHSGEPQSLTIHPEPIDLAPVVEQVLQQLEPLITKAQVQIIPQIPTDLPPIHADPIQLQRIYDHLISNALKHNPQGIKVTLTAMVEDGQIQCQVSDDGVGMEPHQCQRVFDLNKRQSGPRYRPGLGLGLYLCRRIVEAHGGQIGVESQLQQGTTIWFTLPQSDCVSESF